MLYAPAAEYKPRGRFLFVLFRLLEQKRIFSPACRTRIDMVDALKSAE